jgi:hypothetical protein
LPVYWKPKYGSRVMRERAWARQSQAREQQLAAQRRSLRDRLRAWLKS